MIAVMAMPSFKWEKVGWWPNFQMHRTNGFPISFSEIVAQHLRGETVLPDVADAAFRHAANHRRFGCFFLPKKWDDLIVDIFHLTVIQRKKKKVLYITECNGNCLQESPAHACQFQCSSWLQIICGVDSRLKKPEICFTISLGAPS